MNLRTSLSTLAFCAALPVMALYGQQGDGIRAFNTSARQVDAVLGTLGTLAAAPVRTVDGVPVDAAAIRTLCGTLTERMAQMSADFTAVINDPNLSDDEKREFLRGAYLQVRGFQVEIAGLTNLLRLQYTDANGVFLFQNETQLYGQQGEGIIGKFNQAVTNLYGQAGEGIIIRQT